MKSKFWFVVLAVVLFFGGAIWVSEAPIWGPLIAFLEVIGGFLCGHFFTKSQMNLALNASHDQIVNLNEELASLKAALKKLKEETPKAVKPKKNKE